MSTLSRMRFTSCSRLTARDAHDFHQLGGHLGGDLILHTTLALRIGLQKHQNLFFGYSGPLQAVEKLTVAHFAAQFVDARQKLLAVGANLGEKSDPLPAVETFTTS